MGIGGRCSFKTKNKMPQNDSIPQAILGGIPVATIVATLVNKDSIPDGWLLCDGSTIKSEDYPVLVGAIGNTLPNLAGRVLIGCGTPAPGNPIQNDGTTPNFGTSAWPVTGWTGGEFVHKLTINEMPNHNHNLRNAHGGGSTNDYSSQYDRAEIVDNSFDNTSFTGGDIPHNNMPPFLTVSYIIYTGQ